MAKSKYSVQEQARAALASFSRKELAEKLGVSLRTLRRWTNEGTKPRDPDKLKSLSKLATKSRTSISRDNKRIGGISFTSPTPVRGHRRQITKRGLDGRPVFDKKKETIIDKRGRKRTITKLVPQTKLSEWVNYNVQKTSIKDMLAILRSAANDNRCIQFIFRGEVTRNYPSGVHGSSPIQLDEEMSDSDLLDEIFDLVASESNMLFIGVKDDGCAD